MTPEHTWMDQHGIEYNARLLDDMEGSTILDYLGEFTDTWEQGAIEHSTDPRKYRYFIPSEPIDQTIAYFEHKQGKDRITAIRIAGKQHRQNYEHCLNYGNTWANFWLVVTARYKGITIGEHGAGISIDFEPDPFEIDYVRETVDELAADALAELPTTMADAQLHAHVLGELLDDLQDTAAHDRAEQDRRSPPQHLLPDPNAPDPRDGAW